MSFIRGQTTSQQLLADCPGVPLAGWPAGSLRGSPVPAWPIELQDWLHPMETKLGRHHLPRVHCCCLKPEQGEGCLATNSVSHLLTNCCQLGWTLPHRCEARPRAAQWPEVAIHDEAFPGIQLGTITTLLTPSGPKSRICMRSQGGSLGVASIFPDANIPTAAAKKSEARPRAPSNQTERPVLLLYSALPRNRWR